MLLKFIKKNNASTAVETALIMPVLLFGVFMLFELARLVLLVAVGNIALEHALQDFRSDSSFSSEQVDEIQTQIADGLVSHSFGFISGDEFSVEVLAFDNLYQFGGGTAEEDEKQNITDNSPPIISVTVNLREDFITPLPALLGLEDSFQYQYRQLLGNILNDSAEETL